MGKKTVKRSREERDKLLGVSLILKDVEALLQGVGDYRHRGHDIKTLESIKDRLQKEAAEVHVETRYIALTSCSKCTHFDSERHYTGDSYEMESDWFCKEMDKKKIVGCMDHSDKDPGIPDWCPLMSIEDVINQHLTEQEDERVINTTLLLRQLKGIAKHDYIPCPFCSRGEKPDRLKQDGGIDPPCYYCGGVEDICVEDLPDLILEARYESLVKFQSLLKK